MMQIGQVLVLQWLWEKKGGPRHDENNFGDYNDYDDDYNDYDN